ncbi:hypothetical protein KKJ06_22265 [Xenorhabdus bovienii]|nr:hypothetical protein [Xenorhabdus bovienii]MDE9545424.1 hypothetical protein [Xenorhabdus bovienii]MDE9553432.1 hypothetical protein [Xenorhabdus bovienii]MDE9558020.1 hypothetical protein [Xenorhabdus bovienii]
MTVKELRKNLTYLVDKYIPDNEKKEELYTYIQREDVPVKGILADFNEYKTRTVEQVDGNLIREIYFYYC